MAHIEIPEVKKLQSFMKDLGGIEKFVMYYYDKDTGRYRTILVNADRMLMMYGVTVFTEMFGKSEAIVGIELAGQVESEGESYFKPESEN